MANSDINGFYLGANTPEGFYSYFEKACPPSEGWNRYIIKGGPGTGKSTLMKLLCSRAEEKGLLAEHIYCSSDPESLDAVIIPELHTAVFDGTAPHVMEPVCPGACDNIIDLGTAWSIAKLRSMRGEIMELSGRCSQHHSQATRLLRCADAFRQNTLLMASVSFDRSRVERTAERLAAKYTVKSGGTGVEQIKLLSAVTPHGVHVFFGAVSSRCDTVVPVRDQYYAPSAALMSVLRDVLLKNGCSIITCPCSQEPNRIEHIIVPASRTAFTVTNDIHSLEPTERAVHTGRFMTADFASENKQRLSFNRKNTDAFTELASTEMRRAKAIHDELEQCYRAAMDFDAVNELSDRVCRNILH